LFILKKIKEKECRRKKIERRTRELRRGERKRRAE